MHTSYQTHVDILMISTEPLYHTELNRANLKAFYMTANAKR
jgi:hypothetical protein